MRDGYKGNFVRLKSACEPFAVLYLFDFAFSAVVITLSARLTLAISSFIICFLLLLVTYSLLFLDA